MGMEIVTLLSIMCQYMFLPFLDVVIKESFIRSTATTTHGEYWDTSYSKTQVLP